MRVTARLMTTAAFVMLANQSLALTAEQVWANQTAYLAGLGVKVSQTQTRAGAVLTVSDIAYDLAFPFDLGSMSIRSGPQTYAENADGSVAVGYADTNEVSISASLHPDGMTEYSMVATGFISARGRSVLATGTPDHVTYTASHDLMEITISDVTFTGESDLETVALDLYLSIADNATTLEIITSGTTVLHATSATGRTVTDFGISFGEEFQSKTVSQQDSSAFDYTLTLPGTPMNLMNMSQALRDGLAAEMSVRGEGNMSQAVTMVQGEMVSNQSTNFEGSDSTFRFDANGLDIGAAAGGLSVSLQPTAEMPLPIDVTVGSINFRMRLPVNAAPGPVEAVYGFDIVDLAFGEPLWALIDPSGIFPRDPIEVAVALTAEMVLKTDLLDVAAVGQVIDAGTMPFDIRGISIDQLAASAAGAAVSGTGAFTLDMSDLATFDGFPRPTGSATAIMTGINGLLDKLIAAGLIPADDAMQARMMMGMFARVTGDDVLQSTLEINAQGHVIANGQRIQ